MSLRWIERDGKMVLQQDDWIGYPTSDNGYMSQNVWTDVPTHKEPKVDMLVEELANGFRNYAQIGKNYEWSLADYAVKFFRARMPKESTMDCTANFNAGIRKCRTALFGEE